jgi:hypothetical protein
MRPQQRPKSAIKEGLLFRSLPRSGPDRYGA